VARSVLDIDREIARLQAAYADPRCGTPRDPLRIFRNQSDVAARMGPICAEYRAGIQAQLDALFAAREESQRIAEAGKSQRVESKQQGSVGRAEATGTTAGIEFTSGLESLYGAAGQVGSAYFGEGLSALVEDDVTAPPSSSPRSSPSSSPRSSPSPDVKEPSWIDSPVVHVGAGALLAVIALRLLR